MRQEASLVVDAPKASQIVYVRVLKVADVVRRAHSLYPSAEAHPQVPVRDHGQRALLLSKRPLQFDVQKVSALEDHQRLVLRLGIIDPCVPTDELTQTLLRKDEVLVTLLDQDIGRPVINHDGLSCANLPCLLREGQYFYIWIHLLNLGHGTAACLLLSKVLDLQLRNDCFFEDFALLEIALSKHPLLLDAPEYGSATQSNHPAIDQISESFQDVGLVLRHHRHVRIPEVRQNAPIRQVSHLHHDAVFHELSAYFAFLQRRLFV